MLCRAPGLVPWNRAARCEGYIRVPWPCTKSSWRQADGSIASEAKFHSMLSLQTLRHSVFLSFYFLCRVKASAAEVSFWKALCREVVELRWYPVSGRALFGERLRHRPGGSMSARAHVARHGNCSPVLRLTAHACSSCIFMLDVCPATCEAMSACKLGCRSATYCLRCILFCPRLHYAATADIALQAQRVRATLHMSCRISWDLGALQSCVCWDSCRRRD